MIPWYYTKLIITLHFQSDSSYLFLPDCTSWNKYFFSICSFHKHHHSPPYEHFWKTFRQFRLDQMKTSINKRWDQARNVWMSTSFVIRVAFEIFSRLSAISTLPQDITLSFSSLYIMFWFKDKKSNQSPFFFAWFVFSSLFFYRRLR